MNLKELLVRWAKLWHNTHEDQFEDCEIKTALIEYEKGNISFAVLVSIIEDTDDGWADSFFDWAEIQIKD